MRYTKGFTLFELIISIMLIAIISSVVLIAWPGDIITLTSQAESLASDIRYTQTLSMATHERYRINLSNSAQYQILDSAGTAVTIPSVNATAATFASGTSLSSTVNYLVFDTRGMPYTSSTAVGDGTLLTSSLTITLTGDLSSKQIIVTPETGRISIQ